MTSCLVAKLLIALLLLMYQTTSTTSGLAFESISLATRLSARSSISSIECRTQLAGQTAGTFLL